MASKSTLGVVMASRRALYSLLMAIALTLSAVALHPLIPERSYSLVPKGEGELVFNPYGDGMEGGPSHSEWVGPEEDYHWRCRVEPLGDYVYCGLNFLLSYDSLKGMDLTLYDAIELELKPVGHSERVQFFMRHYDERYSNPDDDNSAQFNKFDIMPTELDGRLRIAFDELTLADWWSGARQLPRALRRPLFHNVIAIGVSYSEPLAPGNYDIVIQRARFVGEWISAATWYLSILLLWLLGLSLWGVHRLLQLARVARRHRRQLDVLAYRNQALKQETAHYKQLSTRDALTGAYNRFGFEQCLSQVLHDVDSHPLSLILLDVDHFKAFNDQYGHDAGDNVLQLIVGVIDQHTRQDDILCRWGGEEFLLLCPNTQADSAVLLAEKLRALIAQTAIDVDEPVRLTASFGVCQIRVGEPYVNAFVRTDRALYHAKGQGRNRVILCSPSEGRRPEPSTTASTVPVPADH